MIVNVEQTRLTQFWNEQTEIIDNSYIRKAVAWVLNTLLILTGQFN